MTSNMSSTSFRYMTSFVLLTLGQYLNKPRTTYQVVRVKDQERFGRAPTSSVKAASFSKNCTIQYASCGWYILKLLTL